MNQKYFLERRSCRNFNGEKIDFKELEKIIFQATKAPTCGNMQLYSVIVTQDDENKQKLAAFHYNQPASTTAPVILTICADFYRFTKWCRINKADAGYDNFHSFLTAMTDAIIFAQQIVTIAEQKGYGTCYLGTVTYNVKEISDILNLPELVIPVASIAIGEKMEEGEVTQRLPVESILHREKYHDLNENEITNFYRIHDENPENYKFIKENNKDNLAQVFAEVRYPKQMNEIVSEKFKDILKEKGFK